MLRSLREQFRDRFGSGHALKTPPHLTLVPRFHVAEKCPDISSVLPVPFHPHITLAHRDLDPATFRTAWPRYCNRPLSAAFLSEAIKLFARDGKAWRTEDRFRLGKAPTGSEG